MISLQKPLLERSAVRAALMTIVGIALAATANKLGAQITRVPPAAKPSSVCLAAGQKLSFRVTCPPVVDETSRCHVTATVEDSTGGMVATREGTISVEETQDLSFSAGQLEFPSRSGPARKGSPAPTTKAAKGEEIMVALEVTGGDANKKGGCACGLMQVAVRPPGPGPKGAIQVRPPGPDPK